MKLSHLLTLVVPIVLWSPAAPGQVASGETAVDRGRSLALDICAICHVVASNQRDAPLIKHPTPTFQEVAADPKTNAQFLRRFLKTTHWDENTAPMTMPHYDFTSRQIDDVTAYILSLRGQPPFPTPKGEESP
ncbi:MAG TPA: c-type cytochrome [Caulobacteraceae bacterium]|nr:c-type cytochrome [Caulobacteraceae bacterium]